MTAPTLDQTIDPREAAFGVRVGDPLIVDVRGEGSGWAIIAVGQHTYTVYRDGREFPVPHKHAQHGR
ncbi:hypothetical protein AB0B94_30985 [Micromonospora sp. NPDC048986]|uniref:hypothetical protein n=1 Tax=Micromonospora sp. NPDC048986 TaxID=3155644 RepID=UPI0033CE184A